MAETTIPAERPATQAERPGLKPGAIGFLDAVVIGLASTAPAYSLAAVIGTLVVVVGVQAPGALLAAFIPMFFIATAFFYMNRADPDAGTTFSWVTRALGPWRSTRTSPPAASPSRKARDSNSAVTKPTKGPA